MRPSSPVASILIVDTHVAVLQLMAEVLERAGYAVHTANDPHQALDLFHTHSHDIRLAILDVHLPRINGPELAQRLIAQRPGLRLLFVSEYEGGALIDSAIRGRGMPFLTKPFSIGTLSGTVEALLEDRWASAQSARS